ncbi:MAG: histidine kinase, partial [Bacteroidota bacterium]
NILFGGAQPEMDIWHSSVCYGIALCFTTAYWIVCRYWTIRFRMWFPEREQTLKRLLVTLPVLAVMVVGISAFSQRFMEVAQVPELISQPSLFYKSVMSYTLVMMVMAMYEGAYFFTKFRASQLEQERLARENMQAQLSVLKQQMNPHFLFNSLNTLVNVIPEDTEKATLFTQRLAAVYRRILEYRHKETIPLDEELVALQDYIFLMQTRFEDKLRIDWHLSAQTQVRCTGKVAKPGIPAHLRFHRIVPLSVQLLVENAIKHNVVSSDCPLQIDITLDEDAITVSNRLNVRERHLSSTGWGHENLQRRFAAVTDRPVVIENDGEHYVVSLPTLQPEMAVRAVSA